jgi:hypothetical protein
MEKEIRRSGKTTAAILKTIAEAMLNRDEWIECEDHFKPETYQGACHNVRDNMCRILFGMGIMENEYKVKINTKTKRASLNMRPYGLVELSLGRMLDLRNGREIPMM